MMSMPSLTPHYLPESMQQLMQLIGLPAVTDIVTDYGGTELSIPTKAKKQHALLELVGQQIFSLLIDNYAGEKLWIPLCSASLRALRDNDIINAREKGMTMAQLARQYKTTDRNIRLICAKHRDSQPSPQQDLFTE